MKNTILLIMVVSLVGCGKKDSPAQPKTKSEFSNPKVETEIPVSAFVNTLRMPFVPVPGTVVSFCIWETRVKDYAEYAAANAGVDEEWKNPGLKQADTHPVVKVNWNDAQAFCAWLTKKESAEGKLKAGQRYRLPTDAEWSLAVGLVKEIGKTPSEKSRGIRDVYPWGKEWPPPKGVGKFGPNANVDKLPKGGTDKPLKGGLVDRSAPTMPTGSFAANQHGFYDLSGNVWEWCEDWYDPMEKTYRVLRGASWGSVVNSVILLSSNREYDRPLNRLNFNGFRCVLASE